MILRLVFVSLCGLLGSCGPSASDAGRAHETRISDAEAQALVERAQEARERNSKVTRPKRRFTDESL